jgi:phage shock protein PspC (stress-responsive transcriptional regulator)
VTTEQQPAGTGPSHDRDSTGWVILGVALIALGFLFAANNLGVIPWPLKQMWATMSKARVGIGIVIIGIALIMWAQSGRRIAMPERGIKLYRSRRDTWLAGVLGGLAQYFGIDSTLLRLGFIGLVVLFDMGGLVAAYIVMALVVPREPGVSQPPAAAPPAWPTQPPQPPVAPPPAPEAPAPEAPVPAAPEAPAPAVSETAPPEAPEAPGDENQPTA